MSHPEGHTTQGRRNTIVAMVVIVVIALMGMTIWLSQRGPSTTSSQAENGDSTVETIETPAPTSSPSTAQEELESELGDVAAGYEPQLTPDPAPIEEGAEAAVQGAFEGGDRSLSFTSSVWPSPEAASEYAQSQAAELFTEDEFLKSADVGQPPRGQYWYYEHLDGDGAVFWFDGEQAFSVTGPPNAVQDFFVRFGQG